MSANGLPEPAVAVPAIGPAALEGRIDATEVVTFDVRARSAVEGRRVGAPGVAIVDVLQFEFVENVDDGEASTLELDHRTASRAPLVGGA